MKPLRRKPSVFDTDNQVFNVIGTILFLAVVIFLAWLTYRPLPNIGDGCFAIFGHVSCW